MLDKQLEAVMAQAAEQGAPDFADLPPPECRAFYKEFMGMVTPAPVAGVATEDRRIPGPAGEVPVRIYRPDSAGPHPITMYFHGGGWVIGDLDDYHGLCTELCAQSDSVVVSVDYRLAPEHPYPAAVEDCYAALEWAAANAGGLGADADRIAVTGDSAGGTLAAVCALLARDNNGPRIGFQALVYPVAAAENGGYASYQKYGEGYLLTNRGMQYFRDHYFGKATEALDFRAAPMLADSLADLPPALVVVAAFDPLHDEGLEYAEQLGAAGNHVMVADYPTVAHGFFTMSGALDSGRLAVTQVARAVRDALKTPAG